MRGFLLANVFIVGIVLIAGILAAGAAGIARLIPAPPDVTVWILVGLVTLAMLGTYYATRTAYRFVERRINPRAR